MKNLIIACALLMNLSTLAQEVTITTGTYIVISPDGLNMRMNPDLSSVVLTALPYQAEVEILEERSYGELQVGVHEMCNNGEDIYELPISGHWLRASYAGKEGFVFSGFLIKADYHWRPDPVAGINEDYWLLFPGQFCRNNLPHNTDFSWYGAYQKEDGTVLFESVSPRYSISGGGVTFLDIGFGNNCSLLFVLGTRRNLSLSETKGIFSTDQSMNNLLILYETNCMLPDTWMVHQSEGKWAFVQGGIKQELSVPGATDSYTFMHQITWHGDIDGDGLEDYILRFGEKTSFFVLYLSSEATTEQVARPVSIFYTGYCC